MNRTTVTTPAAAVLALVAALAVGACTPGSAPSGARTEASRRPSCPQPPDIDSNDFVARVDNPYFPLAPGTTYVYKGTEDGKRKQKVVTVTDRTRVISGVTTTVVEDRVHVAGELVEDTIDWYGQDAAGTVWYFGEDTKQIEDGKVVSTEGSFQAGVDGARAGIFMPSHPRKGQTLAAEYARDVAEDCYKILEVNGFVESPFVSSRHALKRDEFSRLDPGVHEHKSFARGVGAVREAVVEGGRDHLELVSIKRP